MKDPTIANSVQSEVPYKDYLRQLEQIAVRVRNGQAQYASPKLGLAEDSMELQIKKTVEIPVSFEISLTSSWRPPVVVQKLAWGAYSSSGELIQAGRTDNFGRDIAQLPNGSFSFRFVDDVRNVFDIDILLKLNDRRAHDHLQAVVECEDTPAAVRKAIRARTANVDPSLLASVVGLATATTDRISEYIQRLIADFDFGQVVTPKGALGLGASDSHVETKDVRENVYDYGRLSAEGILRFEIPRLDVPYDILVLCVIDIKNNDRLVQMTWCMPSSYLHDKVIYNYSLTDLGIQIREGWDIRPIAADLASVPLFSPADIEQIETCKLSNADADNRKAEFVQLYKSVYKKNG